MRATRLDTVESRELLFQFWWDTLTGLGWGSNLFADSDASPWHECDSRALRVTFRTINTHRHREVPAKWNLIDLPNFTNLKGLKKESATNIKSGFNIVKNQTVLSFECSWHVPRMWSNHTLVNCHSNTVPLLWPGKVDATLASIFLIPFTKYV